MSILTSDSDADLIRAWRSGDQESYAVLAVRYQALVRAACIRQAPKGDVDDCVQAVFLVLARRPEAAGKSPALAAWLLRVSSFVCRNASRAAWRRHRAEQAATDIKRNEQSHSSDALDFLDDCLLRLSEKQRTAVTLFYLAGKDADEVANVLGTSREYVHKLAGRGVTRLRNLLAHRGVAVGGAALMSLLCSQSHAETTVPTKLINILIRTPSPSAVALAKGATSAMFVQTAAFAVTVSLLACSALTIAAFTLRTETAPISERAATAQVSPPAQSESKAKKTKPLGDYTDYRYLGRTGQMDTYTITTRDYQEGPCHVRILLPDSYRETKKYTILYLLPNVAAQDNIVGEGIGESERTNIANTYDIIVVEPDMFSVPCYGDNPGTKRRYTEYLPNVIVPFVDSLYATTDSMEGRIVGGKGLAGQGAFTILLHYPDTFGRAFSFNGGLQLEYNNRADYYISDKNYRDKYYIPNLLDKYASIFKNNQVRFYIFGIRPKAFFAHGKYIHEQMTVLGIPNFYDQDPNHFQKANGGWLLAPIAMMLAQEFPKIQAVE